MFKARLERNGVVEGKRTNEDAPRWPAPELGPDGRLSQIGCHSEVCDCRNCEDSYGHIMERSCSTRLLGIEGACEKHVRSTMGTDLRISTTRGTTKTKSPSLHS